MLVFAKGIMRGEGDHGFWEGFCGAGDVGVQGVEGRQEWVCAPVWRTLVVGLRGRMVMLLLPVQRFLVGG